MAQLSNDITSNRQIVTNCKQRQEGGKLELGKFVDSKSFNGLDALRITERFKDAEMRFGAPAVPLEKLATDIRLGRSVAEFSFVKEENAIFVPLIGISDVVESPDDFALKRQNYAQVVINPIFLTPALLRNF